jgi:SAM-dependent methyltransferase
LPVAFSIVCTFGIFTLSGHPLDIPGLMLAVVVLGIGMVFSVYIVRMQQRYMDENHPSMSTIRASVLMAAAVILAGFSVLAFARHPLLSSAGMSTSLGILFTFAGTSLLLPPLLRIVFRKRAFPMEGNVMAGSSRHRRLVMSRFRHLESYARMFARFKMKFDPMFDRLADFVRPGMILDAGCGYGVQGVWLKTLFPGTSVCGLDPDAERVRIARRVLDDVDEVHVSAAQDFTAWPERIDTALMLDMAHYIDDEALLRVLGNLRKRLVRDGRLVIRLTVPSEKSLPWERWLEVMRNRLSRNEIWLRSREDVVSILECAGFRVVLCEPTVPSREETWFVAEPSADGGNGPC